MKYRKKVALVILLIAMLGIAILYTNIYQQIPIDCSL